jgi:hypothetical protein
VGFVWILIDVGVRNRIRVGGETVAERRSKKEEDEEMGEGRGCTPEESPTTTKWGGGSC